MRRVLWEEIPLDTRIDELAGTSFLAARGTDFALGTVLAPTVKANPQRLVEAWVQVQHGGGRRSRETPRHQTLEACCILLGVAPLGAMVVPKLDWLRQKEPSAPWRGRWLEPEQLLARFPTPQGRLAGCRSRVDRVKEEYGLLRGDVVYRIENAALFDPAVPLTRQFETALVLWDDVDAATVEAEVLRRAAMVRVTYDAARAHAETVGLAHLPETARPDAARAAKAARLARATASEAERRTAMERCTTILRSLALAHLPDPDAVDRALPR